MNCVSLYRENEVEDLRNQLEFHKKRLAQAQEELSHLRLQPIPEYDLLSQCVALAC
jgi:hypothetical protein